ncbi:MAG: hypothetical protein IPG88_09005 [Gemmatimonadetes bacterium]|jgi:hypothetical protein|nr:hypothetical protein [Gemmatimonadota bacterium]
MTHSPLGQNRFRQQLVQARLPADLKRIARRFNLTPSGVPADEPITAGEITNGFLDWQERTVDRP